jgi:hypothetical protein
MSFTSEVRWKVLEQFTPHHGILANCSSYVSKLKLIDTQKIMNTAFVNISKSL